MKRGKTQIESIWKTPSLLSNVLLPFSWVFRAVVLIRRFLYARLPSFTFPIPVIVVGNISVGGNGKTPCVIALANALLKRGIQPGIVSRGYGVKPIKAPRRVMSQSQYETVGDEPLIIAQHTGCPVVVCASRVKAVAYLLKHHDCDVVLSDDGLQHYALKRDIEIALIGSESALGNRRCLPSGPLREPISRLNSVDWVLGDPTLDWVEYGVQTTVVGLFQIKTDKHESFDVLKEHDLYAYTGIAYPERFFTLLEKEALNFTSCVYPDHYRFSESDFCKHKQGMIVMTEKDAIKCQSFASDNMYYVKIRSDLDEQFVNVILERLVTLEKLKCA